MNGALRRQRARFVSRQRSGRDALVQQNRLTSFAIVAGAGVLALGLATPATAATTRQPPEGYYQDAVGKTGPELEEIGRAHV